MVIIVEFGFGGYLEHLLNFCAPGCGLTPMSLAMWILWVVILDRVLVTGNDSGNQHTNQGDGFVRL